MAYCEYPRVHRSQVFDKMVMGGEDECAVSMPVVVSLEERLGLDPQFGVGANPNYQYFPFRI